MECIVLFILSLSVIIYGLFYLKKIQKKNSQLAIKIEKIYQELREKEQKECELEHNLQYHTNIVSAYKLLEQNKVKKNVDLYKQILAILQEQLYLKLVYFLYYDHNDEPCLFYLFFGQNWQQLKIDNLFIQQYLHNKLFLKTVPYNDKIYYVDEYLKILKPLNLEDNFIEIGACFVVNDNFYYRQNIIGLYSSNQEIFTDSNLDLIFTLVNILEDGTFKNHLYQQFNLLESAIDSCTNGVIITSAEKDYPIIYVNKGFENITGYSYEEIKGKNCRFLHRDDREQEGIELFRQAINNRESKKIIIRNYRKNGELFWNEVYISPVYNQEGNLINFIGIQNEITEKYLTEQKLLKKTEEIHTLNQQLNLVNQLNYLQNKNFADILNYYVQKITDILDLDIAIVAEIVGYKINVISAYNRLLDDTTYPQESEFIHYLSQKVIKEKKVINTQKFYVDEYFINQLRKFNFIFYLGIPIFIDEQICGVLHFFSVNQNKVNFNYSDSLIESISQTISRIMIAQQIELEKEQISIALQESQERLYDILYSLDDVIWSIHPQTLQLTYINQGAEKLFEVSLSKIFQKRTYWLGLVQPQDRQRVQEYYANLFSISLLGEEVKSHDLEYGIILENGKVKYVRDRANIVYDEKGKKLRIEGILTDITNQTITKKALEKSEKEFRLIFELAPIGMIITDFDGKIIQVNHSFCKLLKYDSQDLLNKNEKNLYHPDDQEKSSFFKHKIITDNLEQYSEERRFLASNGSIVHTIVNITVLRNHEDKIIQFIQQIVDISELKVMEQQIFYDAFYDKLTGLPNRFLLLDRLKQFLNIRQHDPHKRCAILLIDVDKFKKINDSLGHKIGDDLLILIADKIVDCVTDKDTVARISSDEFIVLLPDITSEKEVYDIVEHIRRACFFTTTLQHQEVCASVSIGVTLSSFGYKKADEMIRDADIAMYHGKQKGGNCYQVFNASMHTDLLKRLSLESALVKALENEELELFYQPIVNLKTGFIAGFEALIRWQSPIFGFVSPGDFIPIAEETGLIVPLGNWILSQAVKQIEKWEKSYPHLGLFIAVNVSSRQLLNPNFVNEIDRILENTQINPNLLKIEITESLLMDNFEYAQEVLKQIQARHLKISLDDFGTGYSSLSYLHNLPFNTLKIDRIFIQPLTSENRSSPIVEAIVNLAHNLSLEVVAEGIETEIQEEILQKMNCNYGQGYLYSRPVNGEDADKLIRKMGGCLEVRKA